MKLKFSRNVLVYGEHRAAGTIHEIKDSDAVLLIADRCADRVSDSPAKIEAAESPAQSAAETATIKTRKGHK